MFVLGLTLTLAVLLVLTAVFSFRWAIKDGQLDDLETPPLRMLADDARPKRLDPKEPSNPATRGKGGP